jgi:aryl-alcohol dehydrogenase-like predicted oxidoreductase
MSSIEGPFLLNVPGGIWYRWFNTGYERRTNDAIHERTAQRGRFLAGFDKIKTFSKEDPRFRSGQARGRTGVSTEFFSDVPSDASFWLPGHLFLMEFRTLGRSGLKVPVLSFGTGTFGGGNEFFKAWGASDVADATRLVDICLEAGVNLFDTADVYSDGLSETILGKAVAGRRDAVLISTKATFRMGPGPNDLGSSRYHLIRACEASLRRLGTDYIDIYHLHGFDALTPVEEVLSTLNQLVLSGKVRYIACSNFSGWHLMKSLDAADKYGWARYVGHQVYYSLIGREYEWELMPLALDQGVGALVWSPLGWGRLTGKIRRGKPLPAQSRLHKTSEQGPQVADEHLYKVVDALDAVAAETGRSVPQVALNWLLQRPSISTVIFGARNEEQLRQNLGAVGWNLSAEQVAKLDSASDVTPVYPYWHQRQFVERNPAPVALQEKSSG